jgi:hypothetical protein
MKSSLTLLCKCGHVIALDTIGTERFNHPDCPNCGVGIYLVDDSVVSTRVFNRSRQELESGDCTLAIILTAMTIECELTQLFMCWKEVESMLERAATQIDSNERVESGVSGQGQHSREIRQSLSFRNKSRL